MFTPNESALPGRDFKALNRMAIQLGTGILTTCMPLSIVTQSLLGALSVITVPSSLNPYITIFSTLNLRSYLPPSAF